MGGFIRQLEGVQRAGRPTIASGEGLWERGLVLDAMLIDAGGTELLVSLRNGELEKENRQKVVAAGYQSDQDFACHLAPDRSAQYPITIDGLILPSSEFPEDLRAQRSFVETVLDPTNQAEFSRRKGALPVVRTVDEDDLDACGRRGLVAFREREVRVLSVASASNPCFVEGMNIVLGEVWAGEVQTGQEAFTRLEALSSEARGGLSS